MGDPLNHPGGRSFRGSAPVPQKSYSVREAAAILGISEGGLRIAINKKKIEVTRHHSGAKCIIEISESQLEAYQHHRETAGRGGAPRKPIPTVESLQEEIKRLHALVRKTKRKEK